MIRLITILLLFSTTISYGQYDVDDVSDTTAKEPKVNTTEIKKHVYVGGEFMLSFGNSLYLYMAPLAGYEVYKGLSFGVQTMYQLRRVNFSNNSSISSHAFGGGVFARYRPDFFPYLLFQSEFSVYNVEDQNSVYNGDRTNIPVFMSGLGYAGGFGRAYYHILLMYDFIDDPSMPLPKFFGVLPLYIRYGMVFYLG